MTRGIVILTAITAVRSIANTGVAVWLPTYITFVRGEGVGSALGFTIAAVFIGAIPGQLVFGTLVERLDKRYVLGISSAGAALAVIGYISTGGYLALTFIILFGFFSYSSFPTLLSLATDYVPPSSWTAANGFVWGLGIMGGNVVGPAITQLIIGEDYARLNLAFMLLAIVGLVGAAATPLMKRGEYENKRKTEKAG
jgi:MFS family permease